MKRIGLIGAIIGLLTAVAWAQQDPNIDSGMKPYGSFHGGDIDAVGLGNGNLSLNIPVIGYPQRGGKLSMGFHIGYRSKAWQIFDDASGGNYLYWKYGNDAPSAAPGVQIMANQGLTATPNRMSVPNLNYPYRPINVALWTVYGPDGTAHQMSGTDYSNCIGVSLDASGILCQSTTTVNGQLTYSPSITDSSGIINSIATGNRYQVDPNGNQILASSSGWTDTMGRFIPGAQGPDGSVVVGVAGSTSGCPANTNAEKDWTLPGTNGGTYPIKLCYRNYTLMSNFAVPNVNEGGAVESLLVAMVLPDQTQWIFDYDSYGGLTKLTFPTGGSISYGWISQQSCGSMSRFVATRAVDANDGAGPRTWTYTYTPVQTVVRDPQLNETVHAMGDGCAPYETQTAYYQGSSSNSANLLKTVQTAYSTAEESPFDYYSEQNPPPYPYGGGGAYTQMNLVPTSVTTIWPGGLTSTVQKQYDPGWRGIFILPMTRPTPLTRRCTGKCCRKMLTIMRRRDPRCAPRSPITSGRTTSTT